MTQSLLGKTAVVTGAAGNGMGRSIALTLVREGANVVVNYLTSQDSAAAIVRHIEAQGGAAIACRADATRQERCSRTCINDEIHVGRIIKRGLADSRAGRTADVQDVRHEYVLPE